GYPGIGGGGFAVVAFHAVISFGLPNRCRLLSALRTEVCHEMFNAAAPLMRISPGPADGLSRPLSALRTQLQQTDQPIVLFLGELLDRTPAGLLQDSLRDGSLEIGRDFRISQGFHHAGQRVHEVFHEMFNPACAPTEMP